MKITVLAIFCFIALLNSTLHAGSVVGTKIQLGVGDAAQQAIASKTEIFIKNNSTVSVWIKVSGETSLLFSGYYIRLYNDEIEIPEIRVVMSKSPLSEIFFNNMVPNHTSLWVKDYLPKD